MIRRASRSSLRAKPRRGARQRGPHQARPRHVSRRPVGLRVRRQPERRALRRAGRESGRRRRQQLGRGVGGGDGTNRATRVVRRDPHSAQEPAVPARAHRLGIQRPAARAATAGDRPLGEPGRDYKITHVSRAGLLTGAPARSISASGSACGQPSRPAPASRGLTSAPRGDARRQPRRDAAPRRELARVAHGQYRLRRDGGRHAAHEPDAVPARLPGEADVLPRGVRHLRLSGSGSNDDVRPFFSRRIGLLENREVPLDAGLKVNGREGGTNFGALVVRTGDADAPASTRCPPRTRWASCASGRTCCASRRSGFIATFGDPLGRGNAWLAGPDLTYQTSRFRGDKNFLVGVWGLAMDRDALDGRKRAWGGKIDYPNDLWDIALTYKWLGDGFDPSLGFVPRPGVQIVNFNVNFQPRPKRPILGPARAADVQRVPEHARDGPRTANGRAIGSSRRRSTGGSRAATGSSSTSCRPASG